MKLLVLPQVLHGGEIHTLDINCTNNLAASGGKDLAVNLWAVSDFTSIPQVDKTNLESITPCQTFSFSKTTVKLVRWSPTNEHVFISGNSEGDIYLSNIQNGTNDLIFPWPTLKNSNASVIDGSWSSDGRLFAWSTSDGKVHVYDVKKGTHQELITPTDDKVTVQRSIAFSPTNNYLVSMGDDTLVHIYQFQYDSNENYQFKVLSKTYKLMSTDVTISLGIDYRRISWSCDGEFFSVPNANKQLTSLISLLSRSQGWENAVSLVGHDMECDVVRFGPHIFETEPEVVEVPTPEKPQEYHVYHMIASAGSDNTVVLWNTTKETPVFVLRDITSKPIVDLTWDKTGRHLMMVTLDGHIVLVSFDEGELGKPASPEILEKLKLTQKQNAKPFTVKSPADADTASKKTKGASDVVDQKLALSIAEQFKIKEEDSTLAKKVETDKIKDEESDQETESYIVGDVVPVVLSAERPVEADANDILQSAMNGRSKNATPPANGVNTAKAKTKTAPTTVVTTNSTQKQKVTTKDGKKRIQPILISTSNEKPPLPSSSLTSTTETLGDSRSNKTLMEFERPPYTVSEEVQKENKRNKGQDENGVAKKAKRDLEPVKFVGSVVVNPNTAFAKARLSVPKVRLSFNVNSKVGKFVLDIKNGQGNEATPSRVTYFKDETQIWTDFIPRYIQLATEGNDFWAITTADGQIFTYLHTSGKRILPPIVLGAPLSFLESHGKFLMAVTSVAEIYVWDMEKKKLHMHSALSLASLLDLNNKFQEDTLSKSDNITMCSITSKGIPLATLSNGSGYLFNIDMGIWQTVTEAWWAFGSHYWDSISEDKADSKSVLMDKEDKSSLIGLLENKTNEEVLRKSRIGRGKYFNKISKNMIMKEGFENLENTISLSHLENRILCAEILDEQHDFKEFLFAYVRRVCELGLKPKLYEVCEQLLGATVANGTSMNGNAASPTICGHNKRDLLKELILACAEYRDAQRVLVHFGKQLGMIGEEY